VKNMVCRINAFGWLCFCNIQGVVYITFATCKHISTTYVTRISVSFQTLRLVLHRTRVNCQSWCYTLTAEVSLHMTSSKLRYIANLSAIIAYSIKWHVIHYLLSLTL
jgi:hypothetical protein